jgi:hypothetical protein
MRSGWPDFGPLPPAIGSGTAAIGKEGPTPEQGGIRADGITKVPVGIVGTPVIGVNRFVLDNSENLSLTLTPPPLPSPSVGR